MPIEVFKKSSSGNEKKGDGRLYVSARDRLGDILWKWAGKFHPSERLQYLMDMFIKNDIPQRRQLIIHQSAAPLSKAA